MAYIVRQLPSVKNMPTLTATSRMVGALTPYTPGAGVPIAALAKATHVVGVGVS